MHGHYMTEVHKKLSTLLENTRTLVAKYYDRKRRSIESFKKGELVMLNGKNIRSKGRCKKLDDKMYGLFKVVSVGHNNRYCKLELPSSSKIHPTFNISLLERYRGKNPEMEVIKIEADDAGWTMENVIASGPSNDDASKHVFLVKWKDYTHEENTWETFDNVFKNAKELLEEYYEGNPNIEKDKIFGKKDTKRKKAGSARKKLCKQR